MSSENIVKMFEKLENDVELKKKYLELMRSHFTEIEKILNDKLVEFGRMAGFTFTGDELKALTAEIANKTAPKKELSITDLDNVSGGGTGPASAAVNSYLFQAQAQSLLFANMVNQQAQFVNTAAEAMTQELT